MPLMGVRAYARLRQSDPKTIRQAIRKGLIVRNDVGLIDSDASDASWASTRQAARFRPPDSEAARRAAQARIDTTAARVALAQHDYAHDEELYVDRDFARRRAVAEAEGFLEALRESVDGPAAEAFAIGLRVKPEVGRKILKEFICLLLGEIGDLPARAAADVDRL